MKAILTLINKFFLMLFLSSFAMAGVKERPNTCETHEALAKNGSIRSQVLTGSCYRTGRAGVVDLNKAEYWYRRAAESGDAAGMLSLANLYFFDMKAENKYSEALNLLRNAEEKGEGNASFVLGLIFLNGMAVEKDIEEAQTYFKRASDRGHLWSMLTLYMLSPNQNDKAVWKRRYEETYSKLYSREANFEAGFEKFKNDSLTKEYVIKPIE